MKILICGFAGSGKSTLAKTLGNIYDIEVLHIDKLHFYPGMVIREKELLEKDIADFMNSHSSWVIDGNYYNHNIERFYEADKILYLKFNRLTCLKRILKREVANKGVQRDDMAEGCPDKPDLSFIMWALFGQRRKKITSRFDQFKVKYPDKVVLLKKQKDVDEYIRRIINEREN